jgi:hypothetical protein
VFRLADLQLLDPTPEHVEGLLAACLQLARERGGQLFEVIGLPECLRNVLKRLRPHRRKLPNWPLYYMVPNKELRAAFEQLQTWDLSLYDGDGSIWNQDTCTEDAALPSGVG